MVNGSLSFDLAYLEVSNRMAKHQTTPVVSAIKFYGWEKLSILILVLLSKFTSFPKL